MYNPRAAATREREEKYQIKASCLVIAHIAGSEDGVSVIHPLLVKAPNSKVDRIMRTFQCTDVVTIWILPVVFNPLALGGRVRKDCVVRRQQISRVNGEGVWLWSAMSVIRDLDGAQPLSYIIVEYLDILNWIWEPRIMHGRLLLIFLGSH